MRDRASSSDLARRDLRKTFPLSLWSPPEAPNWPRTTNQPSLENRADGKGGVWSRGEKKIFCTDGKSVKVFSGKQSWEGLAVKGRAMHSHCPEDLGYSKYFGTAKTLGMRVRVVGNEIGKRGSDWVMEG